MAHKTKRSIESFALTNYKSGQYFFTTKKDREITAISSYYKVKIKTERFFAVDTHKHDETHFITKVTIV